MKTTLLLFVLLNCITAHAQRMDLTPERHGSKSYRYLVPNEMYPEQLYQKRLLDKKTGGIILSVGTLRSFYTAGAQRAHELVIVDYDENIQNFNRLHLEILKSSADRFQYLAAFFGTDANPELIRKVKEGTASSRDYVASVLSQTMNQHLPPEQESFQKILDENRDGRDTPSLRRSFKKHFEMQVARATGTNEFYWLNDDVYAHLHELAVRGKISVLEGSFSGTSAIQSLSKSLKRSQEEVSVVDLSNLLEWLSDRAALSKSDQPLIYFEKNIASLPLAADAVFQFTLGTAKLGKTVSDLPSDGKFSYATLAKDEFMKQISEKHRLSSEWVHAVVTGKVPDLKKETLQQSRIHRLFGRATDAISRCFLH